MSHPSDGHPHKQHAADVAASDLERTRVLARIIDKRITELYIARQLPGFTPDLARELCVLEQIRDDWLLEAQV